MEIVEVNGKKYIRQSPLPESGAFRPISTELRTVSKPIDIINPIKPIFMCKGQCCKCNGQYSKCNGQCCKCKGQDIKYFTI
jgi:hypothetical protein